MTTQATIALLLSISDRALALVDRLITNETSPEIQRDLTTRLRTSEEALAAAVAAQPPTPTPQQEGTTDAKPNT